VRRSSHDDDASLQEHLPAPLCARACQIAFSQGFAKEGEGILITDGVPLGTPGTTNMIRIAFLDEEGEPVAKG